jgi:hypothetical protein
VPQFVAQFIRRKSQPVTSEVFMQVAVGHEQVCSLSHDQIHAGELAWDVPISFFSAAPEPSLGVGRARRSE